MTDSSNLALSNPRFHLPEDVIVEILSRLPVDSLLRFTSVCKTWRALIESPNFISKHLKQQNILNPNRNSLSLLVTAHNRASNEYAMSLYSGDALDKRIYIDFPSLYQKDCLSVVGISNGLVCISLSNDEFSLVVCNLSTRRYHIIPDCGYWDNECLQNGEVPLGFGFNPSTNDYKLIKMMRYFDEDNELIEQGEIYTMSNDNWRAIDIQIPFTDDVRLREPIARATINGVFYWESHKLPSLHGVIMSFDMKDEIFRVIDSPQHLNIDWENIFWRFSQIKEELALFVYNDEKCFNVWVLDENQSCWTKKFTVGPFPIMASSLLTGIPRICEISLVGCGKNGDLVVDERTSYVVNLFSYDLRSKEIKSLSFAQLGYSYQVYLYTESLLPVTIRRMNDLLE